MQLDKLVPMGEDGFFYFPLHFPIKNADWPYLTGKRLVCMWWIRMSFVIVTALTNVARPAKDRYEDFQPEIVAWTLYVT